MEEIKNKVKNRTKYLETGFSEHVKGQLPKIMNDYLDICEDHALLIDNPREKEEFRDKVLENIKKIVGIK